VIGAAIFIAGLCLMTAGALLVSMVSPVLTLPYLLICAWAAYKLINKLEE